MGNFWTEVGKAALQLSPLYQFFFSPQSQLNGKLQLQHSAGLFPEISPGPVLMVPTPTLSKNCSQNFIHKLEVIRKACYAWPVAHPVASQKIPDTWEQTPGPCLQPYIPQGREKRAFIISFHGSSKLKSYLRVITTSVKLCATLPEHHSIARDGQPGGALRSAQLHHEKKSSSQQGRQVSAAGKDALVP